MGETFWNIGKLELWNNGKKVYFFIKTNISVFHSSNHFPIISLFLFFLFGFLSLR